MEKNYPDSPAEETDKDRSAQIDAVNGLLTRSIDLGIESIDFKAGDKILKQGEANDSLHVILEGEAELLRTDASGTPISVDRLKSGNFLGLISFWTKQTSFSASRAVTDLKCVRMRRDRFEKLMEEDREFNRVMQELIISNLTQRYRRMALLNVEVAHLTRDLEHERNSLRSTVEDLEVTRNRLIHQEKLATMGQLLAGVAHEINNPSTALLKSVEVLETQIPSLFEKGAPLEKLACEKQLLEAGSKGQFHSSDVIRERMESLQRDFPNLKRSMVRRLAQIGPEHLQEVAPELRKANRRGAFSRVDHLLSFFEIGVYLRSIHSAVGRITSLVRSLKNYGRTDGAERVNVDLSTCVEDTLMVLNNRLKHYRLVKDCPPLPPVSCHPGEINQVLTNLLVNACDATEAEKEIEVRGGHDEQHVWISVCDRGTGIPVKMLDKVFEANVTSKNQSGEFGLGLGLAISRDIIHKHGGRIEAKNREDGGACFTLLLPLNS